MHTNYKRAIIMILLFSLFLPGTAGAGGPLGPPQPLSGETGGLHTALGYWHARDKYESGGEHLFDQRQVYSQLGYGGKNRWEIYARLGITDLNIDGAFSSAITSTTTSRENFEDKMNYFGTLGGKSFHALSDILGIGVSIQGTYYFRDFIDDVGGEQNGIPFAVEMKVKDLWDVNVGLGLQARGAGGRMKFYIGPCIRYAEGRVSTSAAIPGLTFAAEDGKIENQAWPGGFAGLEILLGKGFRLNAEGQYSKRLSAGAAVTYSYR